MSAEFEGVCTGVGCGQKIIWGELNGRPHPYDKPTKCAPCGGTGKIAVITKSFFDDDESTGSMPCSKCKGAGWIRKSHFATCVDADRFRRKKEPA